MKKHWAEDKRNAYDKLAPSKKAEWRREWAEEQYQILQKWRQKVDRYQETASKKYPLINIDTMIQKEGGRYPSVIKGCMRIAEHCIRRGPPWVQVSQQSGRLLFRYMMVEDRQEQITNWDTHTEEFNRGGCNRRDRDREEPAEEPPQQRARIEEPQEEVTPPSKGRVAAPVTPPPAEHAPVPRAA
eukprot:5539178-Pyramimonas_sp.AAC.1